MPQIGRCFFCIGLIVSYLNLHLNMSKYSRRHPPAVNVLQKYNVNPTLPRVFFQPLGNRLIHIQKAREKISLAFYCSPFFIVENF